MLDIIICSYNRPEMIAKTLKVLEDQECAVIISDDGSTDLPPITPIVKKLLWTRHDLYHRVARYNEALHFVSTEKFVILDDDCIPLSANFVKAYEQCLDESDVVRGMFWHEGEFKMTPWFSTVNLGLHLHQNWPLLFDPAYDGRYGFDDHDLGHRLKAEGRSIKIGTPDTAIEHIGLPYSGDRIVTQLNEAYYKDKWQL